jgi:hypothetical protein
MINYQKIQARATNLIVNKLGGIAAILRYKDNTTANTNIVFDINAIQNIDNRQNPTVIAGREQVAYIPYNIPYPPGVGDQIEYVLNLRTWVKRISKVAAYSPTPTMTLFYELTLE